MMFSLEHNATINPKEWMNGALPDKLPSFRELLCKKHSPPSPLPPFSGYNRICKSARGREIHETSGSADTIYLPASFPPPPPFPPP